MTKELKQEYISKIVDEKTSQSTIKFYNSDIEDVFMLNSDEYYPLDKPRIKTRFCFGHGINGISTDEQSQTAHENAETMRTSTLAFMRENLEDIEGEILEIKYALIEDWEEKEAFYNANRNSLSYHMRFTTPYITTPYSSRPFCVRLGFFETSKIEEMPNCYKWVIRKATREELTLILAEKEKAKERFIKRLNTYLKRFGLSKVTSWTYLVD